MRVMFSTYLVAVCAATFSAFCALTWIYTVDHVDPPQGAGNPAEHRERVAV